MTTSLSLAYNSRQHSLWSECFSGWSFDKNRQSNIWLAVSLYTPDEVGSTLWYNLARLFVYLAVILSIETVNKIQIKPVRLGSIHLIHILVLKRSKTTSLDYTHTGFETIEDDFLGFSILEVECQGHFCNLFSENIDNRIQTEPSMLGPSKFCTHWSYIEDDIYRFYWTAKTFPVYGMTKSRRLPIRLSVSTIWI